MKKVLLAMCIVCGATAASAQNFNDYFEDRTLRIDYDFTGDVNKQEISVIRLNAIPRWYGKRQNLAEVPTAGNGDITVRSKDGRVIYKNSFSTLFQEWLAYPEAKQVRKSFENVFLLPGLGSQLLTSVNQRDLPVVQAIVMIFVAIVLVINTAVDIAYHLLDPRVHTREEAVDS